MKVFLWGTGYVANRLMNECESLVNYEILGFIDNNNTKQGTTFYGYNVYGISALENFDYDKVVILTYSFDSIRKQILEKYPSIDDKIENWLFFYRNDVLARYENSENEEIQKILSYIRKNDLNVFNYDFVLKYDNVKIDVLYDDSCNMHYVLHNEKPLYFPREYDEEKIANYYKSLLIEQDEESPHKYCYGNVDVLPNDVILDVGVAEGNFTLEHIDIISHAYLIEADEKWIEALERTFLPYSDKVTIIKAFVSSINDDRHRSLDAIVKDVKIDFIKMDIEGGEEESLKGAKMLLENSSNMKAAICCYHSEEDENILSSQMMKYGFSVSVSEGYMWFPYAYKQKYVSTKLVHGVLRCAK